MEEVKPDYPTEPALPLYARLVSNFSQGRLETMATRFEIWFSKDGLLKSASVRYESEALRIEHSLRGAGYDVVVTKVQG